MNTFFNRWIMETTGLHITPDKQSQVDAALRELAEDQQMIPERYVHLLMAGGLPKDNFIDLITTPESYFLRHKEIMAYVASRIIPKLLQEGKRVRILCLPCARGEEPYTMAMMLHDHGINPRMVEIIGADISKKRIEEARAGKYSPYSLRTVPADFQHRHFSSAGQSESQVKQNFIGSVRFVQANLLKDIHLKVHKGFDIIFCHNLFIYFDKQTIKKGLAIFWELLDPKGWFFVDTTEIPQVASEFQRVEVGSGFGFRKKKVAQKPILTRNHTMVSRDKPWTPPIIKKRTIPLGKKATRPSQKRVSTPSHNPDHREHGADLHQQAKASYRAKDLEKARSLFEKLLTEEQWRIKSHLGLAMICSDQGQQMEAIEHAEAVLNASVKERGCLTRTEQAELHAIMAVTLFNKGLHKQAVHYFNALQKLSPKHHALRIFKE